MTTFRARLQRATLAPDEHNLATLLANISALHEQIREHSKPGTHRIGFDPDFRYDDELAALSVPQRPPDQDSARKIVADMFRGAFRPHDPKTALNVLPPPLLDAVAASTMASLFNVTMIWDFYCGRMILYEKKLVSWLAELAGWNERKAGGLSTFGGKGTLMYPVKSGLNRSARDTL